MIEDSGVSLLGVSTGVRSRRLDAREVMAWVVVIAGVLNFTPTLFSTGSVSSEPVWTKAAKDLPALLLLGALALEAHRLGWPRATRDIRRLAASIGVLALFIVVSALLVASPSAGDVASAQYYVVYPLITVGLVVAPLDRAQIRRVLRLIVGFAVFESLLAFPDVLGVFAHTYYSFAWHGELYNRAIGTLGNPNTLGLFLGLGIIVAASNAADLSPAVRITASAVIVVGIVLTFSKTAALALGLSSFLLTTGPMRRRMVIWAGALVLAALVASTAVVIRAGSPVPAGTTAVSTTNTGTSGSNQSTTVVTATVGNRGQTARNAFDDWTSGPKSFLLGHGYASLADVSSSGQLTERVVDNMPLGVALEGGVVGLVLFVSVLVFALKPLVRPSIRGPIVDLGRTYAAFFLLYSPVAINFRLFPDALYYWMTLGFALGIVCANQSLRERTVADPSTA
jgi:hypothetical protein